MRVLDWRLFAAASLAWATQAFSQASPSEEPTLEWHFNIGASVPAGETSTYLDTGPVIGGGLRWNTGGPWALLAELQYSSYHATSEGIRLANAQSNSVRIDNGWGDIWGLNANGVYKIPISQRARAYVTAGVGLGHRSVNLSQTVLLAGTYCDPWWGYCYPGVIPGQAIVAEQTTTRFAWNVGFGFEFPQTYGGAWFIDARFQRIETQKPTEYIPVQVGFRF